MYLHQKLSFLVVIFIQLNHSNCHTISLTKHLHPSGQVQVKELNFSNGIGAHDLTTKLRQVESWLEKKHHVKVTVRMARGEPAVNLVRQSAR